MALSFESLWNAHPEIKGDANPCRLPNGLKAFDDQCAIRLGTALARCGCDVSRLKAAFCWHHPKKRGTFFVLKKWLMHCASACSMAWLLWLK
ncbi:hypothetical protein ACFFW8_01405 [Erwinia tracheiphila]